MDNPTREAASPQRPWSLPAGTAAMRLEQSATLLRLEGPDSLRFLHGQGSQDLQGARPGQWLRSCCLTPTARVTALVEVLADDGGAWLVITTGQAEVGREQLDRVLFPADQVVLGPLEPVQLITRRPGDDPSTDDHRDGEALAFRSADGPSSWRALLGDPSRGFWLGEHRLLLRGQEPLPSELADQPALSATEAEHWRISRGLPAHPGELNGETNPFELGLAARVSLSKGCYVGQETLARLATYDGVKQQLRRWRWHGTEADAADRLARLQPGQTLITHAGEKAGRITSTLRLEASAITAESEPVVVIGLALVRRAALIEPWLIAGSDPASGPQLEMSPPADFMPPPVGTGRAV